MSTTKQKGNKNDVKTDETFITSSDAYNANLFTSECCGAFNVYNGVSCICSQCGRIINKIKDDEILTISVKYNDTSDTNVSGDIIHAYHENAKRLSTDVTYEICSQECPKCGTLMRYTRDPQNNIIFICSDPKCRNVLSSIDIK